MPGLDPGIHQPHKSFAKKMGHRVVQRADALSPGDDNKRYCNPVSPLVLRSGASSLAACPKLT
jgi:hypothetical protein